MCFVPDDAAGGNGGRKDPLGWTDAKEWARRMGEEGRRRQADITARRLATRKANAKPRRKVTVPERVPLAAFYVPDRLDLDSHPEPLRWYTAYFLNLVRWRTITWRANEDGYAQLLYAYLEKVVPRPALKEVRSLLINREVVECDELAVPGRKAYGYRLTADYQATHKVVCTDDRLNRTIWRVGHENDQALLPVQRWLKTKLADLVFDLGAAARIIDTLTPDRASGLSADEYRLQRLEYAQRVAGGDHWFCADEYGRVHTPVTALERELRPCLSARMGGQPRPIVWLDVRNSQPLLFAVLARQWDRSSPQGRRRIINRGFTRNNPYHAVNQSLTHTQHEDRKTDGEETEERRRRKENNRHRIRNVNHVPTPCEVNDLRNPRSGADAALSSMLAVCEGGRFYESLMTDAERARGDEYRDQFKVRFYAVLFGRNESRDPRFPNELRRRFRERYPKEAAVLQELKRRNYRHSSHLLQNFEATLVIHRICGRVMRERPGTPLYTIHDSLGTTPECLDYVRGVILGEYGRIGIRPSLKETRP